VKARTAILVFTFLANIAGAATDQPELRNLKSKLSAAAALPLGSRPSPPEVDLGFLIGLSPQEIRSGLGVPYSRSATCTAAECWSYRYGPDSAPPKVVKRNDDGTVDLEVTTGGPFLLIIGFSSHHVVLANWQGQK
jgi:hypothetical protein